MTGLYCHHLMVATQICNYAFTILMYGYTYIFLPAGARAARERLVLRLIYVFRVCLFVCLSVCLLIVRPHLSRAQNITSYVTMQLQCIAAFGGLRAKLQQMKVVLCCLDGENVVGSRKDPGLVAYSYYLEAHDETAESALSLYRI